MYVKVMFFIHYMSRKFQYLNTNFSLLITEYPTLMLPLVWIALSKIKTFVNCILLDSTLSKTPLFSHPWFMIMGGNNVSRDVNNFSNVSRQVIWLSLLDNMKNVSSFETFLWENGTNWSFSCYWILMPQKTYLFGPCIPFVTS